MLSLGIPHSSSGDTRIVHFMSDRNLACPFVAVPDRSLRTIIGSSNLCTSSTENDNFWTSCYVVFTKEGEWDCAERGTRCLPSAMFESTKRRLHDVDPQHRTEMDLMPRVVQRIQDCYTTGVGEICLSRISSFPQSGTPSVKTRRQNTPFNVMH